MYPSQPEACNKVQQQSSCFIPPLISLMPTLSTNSSFSSQPPGDTRGVDSDAPEEVGAAVWK